MTAGGVGAAVEEAERSTNNACIVAVTPEAVCGWRNAKRTRGRSSYGSSVIEDDDGSFCEESAHEVVPKSCPDDAARSSGCKSRRSGGNNGACLPWSQLCQDREGSSSRACGYWENKSKRSALYTVQQREEVDGDVEEGVRLDGGRRGGEGGARGVVGAVGAVGATTEGLGGSSSQWWRVAQAHEQRGRSHLAHEQRFQLQGVEVAQRTASNDTCGGPIGERQGRVLRRTGEVPRRMRMTTATKRVKGHDRQHKMMSMNTCGLPRTGAFTIWGVGARGRQEAKPRRRTRGRTRRNKDKGDRSSSGNWSR